MCAGGFCAGESTSCGDGTTDGGCNEQCDDSNTTSHDGCSATCQLEFVCPPTPDSGCRLPVQPGAAQVQLADKSPNSKDRLQWKWNKGALTTVGDFGSPTSTTDYVLCVYDAGNLVALTRIPAGGTCAGRPCWQAKSTGFSYKDKDLTPDGIAQLTLKAGATGKAKIQVKGSRDNLPMPTLPLDLPVVVQLRNSDGVCWGSTFSAPAVKNEAANYKDKAD